MCSFQKKKGICWKMGLRSQPNSNEKRIRSIRNSLALCQPVAGFLKPFLIPSQATYLDYNQVVQILQFISLVLWVVTGFQRPQQKKQKVGTRLPHLLGFSAKPRDNYMLLPHRHCLGRFCGHTPYLFPRLAGHTKFWAVILKEDHYYCISHEVHFFRN